MPCVNCGHANTIRAHLLPQVFCKEVQVGKAHATSVLKNGSFHPSQSGTFDPGILCANCDNKLGALENYASTVLADIRQDAVGKPDGTYVAPPILSDDILRFCAGILWKCSITNNSFGRINLGAYQERLRQVAFREANVPASLDAVMIRLRLSSADDSVFAYRAPSPDRKFGVNLYRLVVGGVLFLIRLDQRSIEDCNLRLLWLRGVEQVKYLILPASHFEEFRIPQDLVATNPKLSLFLEKQE